MTCKSETQSVQSRQQSDPDIHPELTLEQIKKPVIHPKRKKHSRGGTVMNQELDINTMFDFHSRVGLKSYSTISTVKPSSARRSSIAVIGAEKQRKKDYFETHHLNLQASRQLTCQSNSAVHYLAISPPRIRITDDKGSVSPDMFGGRLNAKPTQTKTRKDSEVNEELDQIGELISKISKVETDFKRRTSSTSSSNSSSSTTSVSVFTRGSSIDSRRSSETSRGGYWSHRSRFVLLLIYRDKTPRLLCFVPLFFTKVA